MTSSARYRVYPTEAIRAIESRALDGPAPLPLMERAGLAVAEFARSRLLTDRRTSVLVLAGPGNNGGDALVAALHLKQWWYRVEAVFTGDRDKLSGDAGQALQRWTEAGGALHGAIPPWGRWDLVIDGLFGIGLQRDLEGRYRELVNTVNGFGLPVLAVDIPSGLCSDTGRVRGAAVRASATVTFIGLKPGLLTLDGPDCCGEIALDTLGIPEPLFPAPPIQVLDRERLAGVLPPRRRNSHKGMFGSVGILGGAPGMVGAALLAGRAALQLGAGRVCVGLLGGEAAVDPAQPELMVRTPEALLQMEPLTCLVAGPGLGVSPDAYLYLKAALERALPLVLDADALNLLAQFPALAALIGRRGAPVVLTPHPAEAARLLGTGTAQVQSDRLAAAQRLAQQLGGPLVLKGAGSVCVTTDGRCYINRSGNPGMASAGMGDVLAGMVGAFMAQGAPPDQALLLAVHLHGAAADQCVADGSGPVGLTASETIAAARKLLNRWLYAPEAESPEVVKTPLGGARQETPRPEGGVTRSGGATRRGGESPLGGSGDAPEAGPPEEVETPRPEGQATRRGGSPLGGSGDAPEP